MGTVTRLSTAAEAVTLGRAAGAFLATLLPEGGNTRLAYGKILRRVAAEFGEDADPAGREPDVFAAWFPGPWKDRRPATWNGALHAIRSAEGYWRGQGRVTRAAPRAPGRRARPPERRAGP